MCQNPFQVSQTFVKKNFKDRGRLALPPLKKLVSQFIQDLGSILIKLHAKSQIKSKIQALGERRKEGG